MRRGFLRSTSAVLIGSIVAQISFFLVSPFLTRLYTPAAFGAAGVFSAILAIAATVSTGRFHIAIPIPEDGGDARGLLRLSLVCSVLTAFLLSALFLAFLQYRSFGTIGLRLAAAAGLGTGVVLVGAGFAYNAFLARLDAFPAIGRSRAAQGLSYSVTSLGFGGTGSALGLIGAQLAGQAATASMAAVGLHRRRHELRVADAPRLLPLARDYKSYPKLSSPAAVLNAIGVHAPLLLVPLLFSIETAGFYSLSYRMIIGPAALVAAALSSVFLGSAPDAYREDRLFDEIARVLSWMMRLALPTATVVIIGAPLATSLLFGDDWASVGRFLQLLTPWFVMTVAVAPLSPAFAVLNRLGHELTFQVSMGVSRIAALVVGSLVDSFGTGIALASALTVLHYMGFLRWVLAELGGSASRILLPIQAPALRSVLALGAALLGANTLSGGAEDAWIVGVVALLAASELVIFTESHWPIISHASTTRNPSA